MGTGRMQIEQRHTSKSIGGSVLRGHSECRRQRVLSRSEINTRVCADECRYNRNWYTKQLSRCPTMRLASLEPTLIPFVTLEGPPRGTGSTEASSKQQERKQVGLREADTVFLIT
jgi:hypothetical protein